MKKIMCNAFAILAFCGIVLGQAQYKVLYSFAGRQSGDGETPLSNLVLDRAGNLYGTTREGGSGSGGFGGTVFELSPNEDGTWSESVLYSFCSNYVNLQCLDGSSPQSGLVLDSLENLYGTTLNGGQQSCPATIGCGAVFELSPPSSAGAGWTYRLLYSFCLLRVGNACEDGYYPTSRLVFDKSGRLYGTTGSGGTGHLSNGFDAGTVFQLSPGIGGWTETVLYNFCSLGEGNFCPDGSFPQAGVTFDKSGTLYGTTELGGRSRSQGEGIVYKLSPGVNGWVVTVLTLVSTRWETSSVLFQQADKTATADCLGWAPTEPSQTFRSKAGTTATRPRLVYS
jgi:uncharacterized repeat protein (TIGR03803 family)